MPVLRILIRAVASVIAFLLVFVFVVRVFAPGNADTQAIFRLIGLVQPFLDAGAAFLVFPVQLPLDWLSPYLSAGIKLWFPLTQAAPFFEALVEFVVGTIPGLAAMQVGRKLLDASYPTIFPGVFDWRLVMAIAFWGFVESLLLKGVILIEARLYRSRIRQRDADILASLRDR
jgi:hypothetical protein